MDLFCGDLLQVRSFVRLGVCEYFGGRFVSRCLVTIVSVPILVSLCTDMPRFLFHSVQMADGIFGGGGAVFIGCWVSATSETRRWCNGPGRGSNDMAESLIFASACCVFEEQQSPSNSFLSCVSILDGRLLTFFKHD